MGASTYEEPQPDPVVPPTVPTPAAPSQPVAPSEPSKVESTMTGDTTNDTSKIVS